MALLFPTTYELLQRYVDIRSDVETKQGREGYRQIITDIRDLAYRWSLGNPQIVEFEDGLPRDPGEPMPANLLIDVGEGEETGIFYFHGDGINADGLCPPGINPYHLSQAKGLPGVYEGSKSLDMASGMVATIQALRGLDDVLKKTNRRIKVICPYNEEGNSSGIFEALPGLRDADWAVSTEIAVDSKLGENGRLLYSRPGRLRYYVNIEMYKAGHMGLVGELPKDQQLNFRLINAVQKIQEVTFIDPRRVHDDRLQDSFCHPHDWGTKKQSGYSMNRKAKMEVEVIYTDPDLKPAKVEHELRNAVTAALQTAGAGNVELLRGRRTPWIKPWYEDPKHPLVQAGLAELDELLAEKRDRFPTGTLSQNAVLSVGKPVAEEAVLSNEGVPVIVLPPDGDGEHSGQERTSLPYIEHVMVPFLKRIAGTKHNLRKAV